MKRLITCAYSQPNLGGSHCLVNMCQLCGKPLVNLLQTDQQHTSPPVYWKPIDVKPESECNATRFCLSLRNEGLDLQVQICHEIDLFWDSKPHSTIVLIKIFEPDPFLRSRESKMN